MFKIIYFLGGKTEEEELYLEIISKLTNDAEGRSRRNKKKGNDL